MRSRIIDVCLIFLLFVVFAGQLPPDVNESHYLTKAKHGWDPQWCPDDLFLSSSFSHWLFYFCFGWLNETLPLAGVAWSGRILTWLLLAVGWQRLASKIFSGRRFILFSAVLFLLLNEWFHLAGEWVVGGFESKGIAYFFFLMAIGNWVDREYRWLWLYVGLATAFHVLVGGWTAIALMFAILVDRLPVRCFNSSGQESVGCCPTRPLIDLGALLGWFPKASLPLGLGGTFALIGILPPLLADASVASDIKLAANRVYVFDRLGHHLFLGSFGALRITAFTALLIGLAGIGHFAKQLRPPKKQHWKRLLDFAIGSLLIAFIGMLLSGIAEQESWGSSLCVAMLRFYWFRLADVAVPIAVALGATLLAQTMGEVPKLSLPSRRHVWRLAMLVVWLGFGTTLYHRYSDVRPTADRAALPEYPNDKNRTLQTYQNWVRVCGWIKDNTPENAVFITPDQQQTFKWYAHRTEVVNWKDIPQDAKSMLQWRWRTSVLLEPQRRSLVGLMGYTDGQLLELARQFGATHLLVPQAQADMVRLTSGLQQIYPVDPQEKSTYVVYQLN